MKKQQYSNPIMAWVDDRLPIFSFMQAETVDYPTPKNFNYWWNFGSLALFVLIIMIVTGIFLAMQYTAHVDYAFDSVERIMRDVNYGWLLRYIHMNGASMFFIVVIIHMFRGLYYGSYKAPREILWILGVIIFLCMMGTAFMGYVLPWGQMSFWGATVITNLFSAIPLVGEDIRTLLWGGFSVDNPTLNRFFALHYLLPFVIFAVVFVHLWALHTVKSNNPLGIEPKGPGDTIPFSPYYVIKDYFGVGVFLTFYMAFVFFAPDFFGHPDNYIEADPLVTPAHIVPEWYFLPFYAILRAFTMDIWVITAKLQGVIAMFASILILCFLPWLDRSKVRSAKFRPLYKMFFWIFVADCLLLGYIGGKPAEEPLVTIGQIGTAWYFAHFLIILPLLSRFEKTKPLPESISAAVDKGKAATAALILAIGVGMLSFSATPAQAAGEMEHPKEVNWSFDGIFGTFDRASAQRGMQVFRQVCQNCHSLRLVPFRTLQDIGLSEDQVKAIASEYEVTDGPNDEGEMFTRPATPADYWPKPFANEKAARYANGGAYPPDLSVMTKARANCPNYVYSLLSGYHEAPEDFTVNEGMSYNPYFPGKQIAMAQPLWGDDVEYIDGTEATIEQEAKDVTMFLHWAARPKLEERKKLGIKVMLFLIVLTGMLYALKRHIWRDLH